MGCRTKHKVLCLCCVGWGLSIFGAVMVPLVNLLIKKKVQESVMLVEGRVMYPLWRDLPIPIYMQFYMFDVTNKEEVLKGGRPMVVEKGPYTYKETRTKFNITHHSNGTVSYRQNRTFHFVPEMSVGKETDMFTTPNPVYWTLISSLKWIGEDIRKIINIVTEGIGNESVFMERSMYDIVWGYQDEMLTLAKYLDSEWFYTDVIGYFMNKNYTDDGEYTVFTGEKNIELLGGIDKYDGSRLLNFWTTKYANMVNGTDGTLGPPFRKKQDSTPMFSSDVCRSIQGQYDSDVSTKQGINLYRYTAPLTYMANATINHDNIGFCTPQSKCLDTGMLNISTCQLVDYFHIPVAVSFPHFYLAAKQYTESILGLHPIAEQHQTAVDIEPYTGLVLQAAKRLQVNLYIQPIENIEPTLKLRNTFVPVFWLNESAVIDDKNSDLLKSMLFTPLIIVEVVEIGLMCCGGLVLLLTLIYGLYKQQSDRKDNSSMGSLNRHIKQSLCCRQDDMKEPILTANS